VSAAVDKALSEYLGEAKRLYDQWWQSVPDSRLADASRRRTVFGPLGVMTDAFCANCGAPYGLVTMESVDHLLVICQKCDGKLGRLPLMRVPDAVERTLIAPHPTSAPEGV
jgi:hypothetical protein